MWYVTMTDKFMSGWGQASGTVNKLVISCNTYNEAVIVTANAERRGEMRYVNICSKKPYYPGAFMSRHGRVEGDYASWFVPQLKWR